VSQLCAVCDSTNETTALCTKCLADPANQDWVEQPAWEIADSAALAVAPDSAHLVYEEPVHVNPVELKILALADRGSSGEIELVTRFDSKGRKRGTYSRNIALKSKAAVARAAGCHRKYAERVLAKWWKKPDSTQAPCTENDCIGVAAA